VTITPEAGRVLGCLVEKQLTTPQQYPLTLNALTLACSQSTNREPVMTLDDGVVQGALQELKELHMVRFVLPSHGKSVTRYRHVLDEAFGLDTARVALMAVLLLRGPQTPGELRTRTGRMTEFDSLAAIQGELEVLGGQPTPLVRLLPRQPGQKEDRWRQLLAAESSAVGQSIPPAEPAFVESDSPPLRSVPGEPTGHSAPKEPTDSEEDRSDLEHRIEMLQSEVAALRGELGEVRASLNALRQSLGE
jgi:uncharacterized protein YceH (UPF0502 family)